VPAVVADPKAEDQSGLLAWRLDRNVRARREPGRAQLPEWMN